MQNPRIDEYGTKRWYNEYHKLHRTDGPAVMWLDGTKYWYINGKAHRTDGPAIIYSDGSVAWCINAQRLTIPQYYLFNYLCKIQE